MGYFTSVFSVFLLAMFACFIVSLPIVGLSILDCNNYQEMSKSETRYSVLADTCYVKLPNDTWVARDKFEMSAVFKG